MKNIPQKYDDLLADDTKAFAFLGTIMEEGSPQVTPLWFNIKDNHIWINSARGRTKDRNIRRNPKIAIAISDPENPYRYLQIRGKVIEIREEKANDHINELSMKYGGMPFPIPPGEIRIIYIIDPLHVSGNG